MRRTIFLFLVGLFVSIVSFGQRVEIPIWIRGTWHNSAESNTNNFVYFTFSTNKIEYCKGFPKSKNNTHNLFDSYDRNKTKTVVNDSLFRISFKNNKESKIYEFKLIKVDSFDKPVLSFSIKINGKTIKGHSTSCQTLLTRI